MRFCRSGTTRSHRICEVVFAAALRSSVPVLSPDGTRIVFTVITPERLSQLALRTLESPIVKLVSDTASAFYPFWSPDGTQIAFGTDRQGLRKIDLTGGPAATICEAPAQDFYGGTWNQDGVILLHTPKGIARVTAGGGPLTEVTKVDTNRGETGHYWPFFLPDGRHFLFTVTSGQNDVRGIYVGDLASAKSIRIVSEVTNAQYSPPGFLLFARGNVLTALPFDAGHLRATGNPFPVNDNQGRLDSDFVSIFSTAAGHLVYGPNLGTQAYQMVWFDRKGTRLSTLGAAAEYTNPALSPDGRTLAVGIADQIGNRDIWLFDLVRGTSMRLTFDPSDDLAPTWSPDGRQIIFASDRKGARDLYRKAASGTGQEELLLESKVAKVGEDWTRDGKYLVFNLGSASAGIWALELTGNAGERKPVALLTGAFSLDQGRVSPDGRWLAYRSTETGKAEVYVQNFPPSGGKWQISTVGGAEPQWRADGKELFYVQNKTLMTVEIASGPGRFEAGIPKPLFEAQFAGGSFRRNRYVVSADGQKFLVVTPLEQTTRTPFTLVLNWTASLKR